MLAPAQKRRFHDDGYLVIPGAVPAALVTAARHAIHHCLGEQGMNKEDLPTLRAQSYCRELRGDAAITDLATRSAVVPVVESLMGEGNLSAPGGGQIALRFPLPPGQDPPAARGHLDGLGSGANGMDKGVYRRGFTGLAVIYLADVPAPYMGNFTVWPGSHRFFEAYFREHGHQVLADGMPRVDLPQEPVQIAGRAGDLIVAHHQLVHGAAPNASSEIRYAAIFRLRHKEVEAVGLDAYTDIWREWPGVAEATEAAG